MVPGVMIPKINVEITNENLSAKDSLDEKRFVESEKEQSIIIQIN